jgi:flagellar biosynthesis chaperone FliJ
MSDLEKQINDLQSSVNSLRSEVFQSGKPVERSKYDEFRKAQSDLVKLEKKRSEDQRVADNTANIEDQKKADALFRASFNQRGAF